MFLRYTTRKKNGKEHRYYSLVENRRVASGRVVQRHALYLGEINDSQQEAWRKTIEIFQEGQARPRTVAFFPEDRIGPVADADIVRIRLKPTLAASTAAMGCLLVGGPVVGTVGVGSILGGAPAAQPQGHALGLGAANPGGVSAAGSGQRVAALSALV